MPAAKILAYLIATILLGALLAPPLFWAGQAVAAQGVMPFLAETPFQKFFHRAVLIAAVALLWPVARWLRIGRINELGLARDQHWGRHLTLGFLIAAVAVAAMSGGYVAAEIYKWKSKLPWDALPKLALSAVVVAMIEEALFRGAILGMFRRSFRPHVALFWTTTLFAALHFLKPDDIEVAHVSWSSGFALLPHTFHAFAEPAALAGGFSTLFVLGWVLGYAVLRTRALWMSIGLHAGVVFVKMGFSKFTKRLEEHPPWVGSSLEVGLAPMFVLALAGVVVWLVLKNESPPHRSAGE